MDNIIEIIVFFFVIYSILGSVFGKKKTQQKKGPQQYKRPVPQARPRNTRAETPRQQSSQDILEELFGIKIPKPEEETNYGKPIPADDLEYSSWDPEKDFQKKVEQREKYEYRNIEKSVPDVNYDKISTLETSQRKIKSTPPVILQPKKEISKRTIELRQKLRDTKNLQDLFLISEILGKPRAMRKVR